MIKKISAMQCGLFLFLSIISLKFLVFPSIFSQYAYRDLYFPVLIGLLIDLFFTVVVVNIIIKNPHLTFKELLTRAFGKTFAKIALIFLFVYFFVKGVVIVKETHNYFNETLFEKINWFLFIIPLFFLMGFIMLKNFRAIGRSLQFLGPLMLLALLFTILIPLSEADFSNLLPMFENGANGIFKAVFFCSFTFGDYFVLFLFMGRINIKPNSKKTIMWYVICADVLVFAFYVVFAGIFGLQHTRHFYVPESLQSTSNRDDLRDLAPAVLSLGTRGRGARSERKSKPVKFDLELQKQQQKEYLEKQEAQKQQVLQYFDGNKLDLKTVKVMDKKTRGIILKWISRGYYSSNHLLQTEYGFMVRLHIQKEDSIVLKGEDGDLQMPHIVIERMERNESGNL